MNNYNGTPGRRFSPGNRPARRFTDAERIAAANRAARRAQEDPLPHAPRRRRTTPVDFAAMYDLQPDNPDAFDLEDDMEDDMEDDAGYDIPKAPVTPPSFNRHSPSPAEPPEPDAPGAGSASRAQRSAPPIDDSFLDEPDVFPSVPARHSEAAAAPKEPDSLEKLFSADNNERREEPPFSFDRGGKSARREKRVPAPAPAPKKKRKPRASRFSRKTKTIITLILIFIAANLIWISIWLFNNFTFIGGDLYSLDTTELDLSGQGISSVMGISRLTELRRLDLSGNDISIRQYNRLSKKLPGCEIVWDVPVGGGATVGNTVSDADLSRSDGLKISGLNKSLPYMTALKRLDLSGCGLDEEKLYELERAYGGVDLVWDVDILGQMVSTDSEVVSVGKATVQELEEIAGKIKYFDKLSYLDLGRCGLSESDMYAFAAAHPEARAAWETELFGQKYYTNTPELHLESTAENPIDDISALRYFYKLQSLSINKGELTDLSPLRELTTLRILSLTRCKITDISDLGSLTGLVYLELNYNKISNLSPLSGLSALEELHLNNNEITDISPLSGLENLRVLNVQNNQITSVNGFGNVPSLETLSLRYNHLSMSEDVTALLSITSLRMVDLQQNDFRLSVEEVISKDFSSANPDCTLYIWQ